MRPLSSSGHEWLLLLLNQVNKIPKVAQKYDPYFTPPDSFGSNFRGTSQVAISAL